MLSLIQLLAMMNFLINNILKEYNKMKEKKTERLNCPLDLARVAKVSDHNVFDRMRQVYWRIYSIYETMLLYYWLKCRKNTER